MRVAYVVVGRRRPQHHDQHETPHYAEEREAIRLPIDACRVVEVSTSTEMGSGYWE